MVDEILEFVDLNEDREKLRSLGYNRVAEYFMNVCPAIPVATLMSSANYGKLMTPGNNGSNKNFLQMTGNLGASVQKMLLDLRDTDALTKFDIWTDTGHGGLYSMAQGYILGYLQKTLDAADLKDSWFQLAEVGTTAALAIGDIDRTHATETGSEDWLRTVGWYSGKVTERAKDIFSIKAAGNAEKHLWKVPMLRDAMTFVALPAVCAIQSGIALLQIGRKLGVILPKEYDDFMQALEVPENFKYLREGQYPDLDCVSATTSVAVDGLADYIDFDWSFLPESALDSIIKKRSREWNIPAAALAIARDLFGLGYSEVDFPTAFVNLFLVGDELNIDLKKVGYGILWAIWYLDEFFGAGENNLPGLWAQAIDEKEHWTYGSLQKQYGSSTIFTKFGLGTLKGYINPENFNAVRWFYRTENTTKVGGYYVNPRLMQQTDPILLITLTSADAVSALYARGIWTPQQAGKELLMELLFKEGEADLLLGISINMYGEHYYTRSEKVINYVCAASANVNRRFGSDPIYSGNYMIGQCAITIEDMSGALTQRAIETRLPMKRFPMPKIMEDVYDGPKKLSLAKLIMGLYSMQAGGSSSTAASTDNSNTNGKPGGEEETEEAT